MVKLFDCSRFPKIKRIHAAFFVSLLKVQVQLFGALRSPDGRFIFA